MHYFNQIMHFFLSSVYFFSANGGGGIIDLCLEGLGEELWPGCGVEREPHGRLQHAAVLLTVSDLVQL